MDAVLKNFLVSMLLGLLVMSSQIASTAYWNIVKHCNTKAELARRIEDGRREGQKVFIFTLSNFKVDNREELIKFGEEIINKISPTAFGPNLHLDDEYGIYGARFTYMIKKEYPGTNVANAYLSSNQHQAWMNLTNEEQKLYNIAVGIVDEANKRNSEVEKARYIHDAICEKVLDYKDENERNKTAAGA